MPTPPLGVSVWMGSQPEDTSMYCTQWTVAQWAVTGRVLSCVCVGVCQISRTTRINSLMTNIAVSRWLGQRSARQNSLWPQSDFIRARKIWEEVSWEGRHFGHVKTWLEAMMYCSYTVQFVLLWVLTYSAAWTRADVWGHVRLCVKSFGLAPRSHGKVTKFPSWWPLQTLTAAWRWKVSFELKCGWKGGGGNASIILLTCSWFKIPLQVKPEVCLFWAYFQSPQRLFKQSRWKGIPSPAF